MSIYALYISLFLHGYVQISNSLFAETSCGVVKGFMSNGIVQFLGIPYALPPTGIRRFHKPIELTTNDLCAEAWNITSLHQELIGNEDCLYLNIFMPPTHKLDELHPVIFIIGGFFFNYGGASNGSAFFHQPDPETVTKMNVIYVTLNYRLGPFGFLTHPSTKVSNIGIRDQLAGLRWVRTNIRQFGGDPLKITIFSYGSGATTVLALLGSTIAQNLFEKAWISAPALQEPGISLDSAVKSSAHIFDCANSVCPKTGEEILRLWNWSIVESWIEQSFTIPSSSNIACLPGLPCHGGILVLDGEVVTNNSWNSQMSPIPIVVGQNSHEAEAYPFPNTVQLWTLSAMTDYIKSIFGKTSSEFKLITRFYHLEEAVDEIHPENRSLKMPNIVEKYSQIVTDIRVTCPLQYYARSLRRVQPTFRYYIRSHHAHFNPYGLDSFVSSAFHGWDAFLLFKTYRIHPDYRYAAEKTLSSEKSLEKLSDNFCTSLKHFIWRGNLFPEKANTLLTIFENDIVYSTSVDELSMCKEWNSLLSNSPYLYAWKA
ncbi:unnamed protein product [Mesocestoides corti]|uniref:Carboxylesterase type B domain-containing protein n=1 Tax=Mesocestoides corti TaxID=53468 RepID=A0A0R3U3S8_MESCO|nr:unnamed protein product [Mesocestoides corti]